MFSILLRLQTLFSCLLCFKQLHYNSSSGHFTQGLSVKCLEKKEKGDTKTKKYFNNFYHPKNDLK